MTNDDEPMTNVSGQEEALSHLKRAMKIHRSESDIGQFNSWINP